MVWDNLDSVRDVIERHLPCPDSDDRGNDGVALVWNLFHATSDTIWHKEVEQRNLKDLRRALIQAQRAWHRLHPGIRDFINLEASKGPPEPKDPDEYGTALRRWEEKKIKSRFVSAALSDIADFFEPSLRDAKILIKYGVEKGQTGWEAIVVIDHCRNIWRRRTGLDAPTRGLNEASPFGLFTKDIFKACKLKFSRGAFDAWVRVQNSE